MAPADMAADVDTHAPRTASRSAAATTGLARSADEFPWLALATKSGLSLPETDAGFRFFSISSAPLSTALFVVETSSLLRVGEWLRSKDTFFGMSPSNSTSNVFTTAGDAEGFAPVSVGGGALVVADASSVCCLLLPFLFDAEHSARERLTAARRSYSKMGIADSGGAVDC